jgi:hypothetical protein
MATERAGCGSEKRHRVVLDLLTADDSGAPSWVSLWAVVANVCSTVSKYERTLRSSHHSRICSVLDTHMDKMDTRRMFLLLLILGIALFAYDSFRPRRRTMRNRMDTTSIDIRWADDGRGDGHLEDPQMTWFWTNY